MVGWLAGWGMGFFTFGMFYTCYMAYTFYMFYMLVGTLAGFLVACVKCFTRLMFTVLLVLTRWLVGWLCGWLVSLGLGFFMF